jgi:hypothetical protein
MSQLSTAARTFASDTDGRTLFKDDRPRRIDRVIDYFGDTAAVPTGDPCGERVFDDLGSDDE